MTRPEPPSYPDGPPAGPSAPPDLSHLPPPSPPGVPPPPSPHPLAALVVVGAGLLFTLPLLGDAAWGENFDDDPMGVGEGLVSIGVLALFTMTPVVVAAGLVWRGSRTARILAVGPLLLLAGLVGFVGAILLHIARVDLEDH